MLFLDTHIAVWLASKQIDKISTKAKGYIEKHGKDDNLYISPMVQLELEYLFEVKKISHDANFIINKLFYDIGLKIDNANFAKVINSSVDIKWTRDPFDRIITAQALTNDAQLITKDDNVRNNYKKAIW